MTLTDALDALGVEVDRSLEEMPLPMILIDRARTVRWQNRAADGLIGRRCGSTYTDLIAPDYRRQSLERFTAFMFGGAVSSDVELVVVAADGNRARVAVTTIPMLGEGDDVVAILTTVKRSAPDDGAGVNAPPLPPRQRQTLELLAEGRSTAEIAQALGVTLETARNYIRRLLRNLGAHSRLEAVARAREAGLL